jgi:hypothetical protein
VTLGPFFSPKIKFLPTSISVYYEDPKSGFVPFSDGQEDKQRLFIFRLQYKKVLFLSLPRYSGLR